MSSVFLHKLLNELPEESRWILMDGMPNVAQHKIYQLLLQLEQDILRKVLVKYGKDSEQYKFYNDIKTVLYQAGEAQHLVELLNKELMAFKEYNQFLKERNAALEKEVNRFKTIEELQSADLLEIYTARVKQVLETEKKTKPQK